MSLVSAIVCIIVIVFALSLVFQLAGFAAGLAFDILKLAAKLLPVVLIVAAVAFFVQGGKITRSESGNVILELPEAWRKR